jgi:iron complex transport system ATP-binding protein
VLNLLDTDQATADLLKIPIVSEAPLSPITDAAYHDNLRLISKADVVVLTSFPFGRGNLRNIDAASFALDNKIPTLMIDDVPIENVTSQKKSTKKLQKLKNKGAITVEHKAALFSSLTISHDWTQKKDSYSLENLSLSISEGNV